MTRELLPTATPAATRTAVRALLRPRRRQLLAAFGVLVVATATGLLVQPLVGRIVDVVAGQGGPRAAAAAITETAALLAAVAVAQGALTALGLALVSRLGESALADLRERFVERVFGLPLERVERAGSGDLTARVTGDVTQVAEAVRNALPELARSVLAIVLTLGALALLDWRFLLAALVAVPVQAHTARWYVRRALPVYAAGRVAGGALQQQLLDTIGGASTVRSLRAEAAHAERVAGRSMVAVELTMRGVRLVLSFYSRLHIAEYAGLVAILVTGFLLVRDGSATIGTATAAALYFHNLFGPINSALVLLDDAQSATAALARLVGVTSLPEEAGPSLPGEAAPSLPADAGPARPRAADGQGPGTVEVTSLEHAYDEGHPVLHGVDLTIAPGERVALVGASGAGKTTLAKLVAGVHRPTAGLVRASGGAVALVTQEVHVFAGPLADDLRLARPDATDAEIDDALRRVGALDWVRGLPEGTATVVGEGGHRLTAAQRQQLALARLVLAAPAVAVLDEATAEAGSAGARVLDAAIEGAVGAGTALIVAHRLSQAATADRVVVMDGGRIVEHGTHDHLRAAGGRYAELWTAWSADRDPGRNGHADSGENPHDHERPRWPSKG